MKPLIVIAGPTASGKTSLSIDLAKRLNGQIVSADSMQIYRYMNIGTAKPTEEEKDGIKHYLIDEVEPNVSFSVADYKERADKYIDEIISKGKLPIMIGGTGLYINTVIDNIKFSETVCDYEYRNKMNNLAIEKGNEYIHKMLEKVDPITAEKLHINDRRRIIRALEVFEFTKVPMSKHIEESKKEPSPYKLAYIGLDIDRKLLYERINLRVDIMIKQGLVKEVKHLLDMGYHKSLTSMKGLGYKEIIEYLEGNTSFDQAVEIIKRDTRRYAKRQLTWFRRDERINWVDPCNKNVIQKLLDFIEKNGILYYNKN